VSLEPLDIVAEGEWVVARCYFIGTHKGVGRHPFVHEGLLAGVPATGKSVKVQHIHMFRLKDGLVIEHWANRDDINMMRQLGLFDK
jgi:predicted ester cyclase